MKKIRIISILLLAALALTLSACNDLTAKVEDAINGVVDSANEALNSNSQAAEVDKHNAYIDLYNVLIDDIDQVVFDYVEEFGSDDAVYIENGFSGFSMYSNSIISDLDAAMPYTEKSPAEPEADAALKALEPDLRSYANALSAARTYYADKNYVDDNFAKSQEYHDIIIGQYDALWEKIMVYIDAVNVMLEGQDEEELARYKDSNQMVHYYALLTLVKAQEIDVYLSENDITYENILDVNLETLRPIYDEFAAAYTEWKAILDANPDAGDDEGIMTTSSYSSTLSDLKSSLSELIDRLQNGKAFGNESLPEYTDGTPENIDSLTSELLNDYNTWIV